MRIWSLWSVGLAVAIAGVMLTPAQSSATVIISSGHWDLEVEFEDGAWDAHWKDDVFNVKHELDEAIMLGNFDGATPQRTPTVRPAGSQWDFIGVAAGETFYVFPKSNAGPGLPQLGLAAEDEDEVLQNNIITLTLTGFSGPAGSKFALYDLVGSDPVVVFEGSGSGASGSIDLLHESHQDFNWSFTHLGDYQLTFQASGVLGADTLLSEPFTAHFSIVPEPASLGLIALSGLMLMRRRR